MKKIVLCMIVAIICIIQPITANGIAEGKNITQNPDNNSFNSQITDSFGRVITLTTKPERIISLGPNVTETLFALGLGKNVVGRTDYCDFPAEVINIPSIGKLTTPSIETIIDLDPDLVIGSTHVKEAVLEEIQKAGIPAVGIYSSNDFEGISSTIRGIAKITGTSLKAEEIIAAMFNEIVEIQNLVADLNKPSVYYVVGFGDWGDFTAGGDTFISDMISMAGGRNIAEDSMGWSYSIEQLIENDPDIIICSKFGGTLEAFANTPVYNDLRAVKSGNLFEIDENILNRQGIRNSQGVLELAKIIHPEVFPDK